jgi:hypothetical protein
MYLQHGYPYVHTQAQMPYAKLDQNDAVLGIILSLTKSECQQCNVNVKTLS